MSTAITIKGIHGNDRDLFYREAKRLGLTEATYFALLLELSRNRRLFLRRHEWSNLDHGSVPLADDDVLEIVR